jgi:hypothetical protein
MKYVDEYRDGAAARQLAAAVARAVTRPRCRIAPTTWSRWSIISCNRKRTGPARNPFRR